MHSLKKYCCIVTLIFPLVTIAQYKQVTVSGTLKHKDSKAALPYVNIVLKSKTDSSFIMGTVTNEEGRFELTAVKPGDYLLEGSMAGFITHQLPLYVGSLTNYLELPVIELGENVESLQAVTVSGRPQEVSTRLDKKIFSVKDNISQAGGSVLETMKNLPGITISQEGKVQLRGNEKVMILVDGKQTALTGFGGQSGLDNIPASAIERIEIINNPSARYDANGNAGIINIIYKKEKKEGFNGKVGLATGLGAWWVKKENYPGIAPQYRATPKVNPSLSLNYHKNKVNIFLQADNLFTHTLNKNEFVDRFYDNGDTVRQQTRRNRSTNIVTTKTGIDWYPNASNMITVSGLFSSEKILDHGDEPFFNGDLTEQKRLWHFLEDELKTTVTATAGWQHKFKQPGRSLSSGIAYTFHREDEKYFFNNILPGFTGSDSFKLLSDERVVDWNIDYVQPLHYGRFETGLKFRRRTIPANMQFKPGVNSPLDTSAGGWASYEETIPALYGTYIFENRSYEIEAGLRVEYVDLQYHVNPNHRTYKSDGYTYTQPFPNLRIAYKFNEQHKISFFYNRRVDRPNEVDIRIFPKYDDAEIIKVGNPALQPQFTNTFELGYKTGWTNGYLYSALYHKRMDATIVRIAGIVPGSTLVYTIFQNAGKSFATGAELLLSQNVGSRATINLNLNGYNNRIDAFTVVNKYPVENTFTAARQQQFSGNIKLNGLLHFNKQVDAQLTLLYLAPDVVPQGKTGARFSIDAGIKKAIQKGKGELFLNATDIANTYKAVKEVNGDGFRYYSTDYFETQVVRLGYSYKF